MPKTSLTVRAEHHLLMLVISDEPPDPGPRFDWLRNGLVDVTSRLMGVWTGAHTGPVHLTVDARTQSPKRCPPIEEWDEVVEASFASPNGFILIEGDPTSPRLDLASPGAYRIRVHARGRDRAGRHSGVTHRRTPRRCCSSCGRPPSNPKRSSKPPT